MLTVCASYFNNQYFCILGFRMVFTGSKDYFLKQRYQIDLVKVKCGVLSEVRTEFLKYYLDEGRVQRVKIKNCSFTCCFICVRTLIIMSMG
jgi:hypothetical protein